LGIGPNPQSPIPNPQSPIPKEERKVFIEYILIKIILNLNKSNIILYI